MLKKIFGFIPAKKSPCGNSHHFLKQSENLLLLLWLTLTGMVVFGLVVSLDQGLIQGMIHADRSYICIVIIFMYLIGLAHTFRHTLHLSREIHHATFIEDLLHAKPSSRLNVDGHRIQLADGTALPEGFVTNYIIDLTNKVPATKKSEPGNESGNDLLDAYASKIRSTHEFGWFYIDLMLKVGFLGTLVGFILMLGSISSVEVLDAATMQKVLAQMSVGMSTALYTTLASLVGGILLGIPYHMLERALNTLLETTIYLKEVQILPRLSSAG